MPGPRASRGLPRHLQRPPTQQELENRFAELPLLVHQPDAEEWVVKQDDAVCLFLPAHKDEGLGAKGTLIDGATSSNVMRLAQAFFFALCWSEPARWNDMKCMVAVLHRDTPDDMHDASTQLGVLLYFQHEPRVFKKKKAEGETDEEPGDEVEERRLAEQLDQNFDEMFTFLHDNPEPALAGAGAGAPSAKRSKRSEATGDCFSERVRQAGVRMHAIPTMEAFSRLVFALFPRINRKQYDTTELRPSLCFSWESMVRYAAGGTSGRAIPAGCRALQWLQHEFHDGLSMGTSGALGGVDLYFPSKKFCSIDRLFSVHIPREFAPPLNPEQIRELYASLHEQNGEYAMPDDFSDTDVLYAAFRHTYGHDPTEGVVYPDALAPNDPAYLFRSITLEPSFDFITMHKCAQPYTEPRDFQAVAGEIHHMFRGASGPTASSGMTHWLRTMQDYCALLPDIKALVAGDEPLMQVFFKRMQTKSPAKDLSAYFALEGVLALVSIGSDSSEKKHMLLSGEMASGKTIMLDAITPFANMRTEVPTSTVWGEWGQLKTQFVAQRMNEAPPEIQASPFFVNSEKAHGLFNFFLRLHFLCCRATATSRRRARTRRWCARATVFWTAWRTRKRAATAPTCRNWTGDPSACRAVA